MTINDIVRKYFKNHPEYDGLFSEDADACGCSADDLYPCGEPGLMCEFGYRKLGPSPYDGKEEMLTYPGPRPKDPTAESASLEEEDD